MATILIVDDRPINRELLVTLLTYTGHRPLEAADGEEGLEIARAEHPDLIITDIVMPRMDGYEFARQVRADPSISNTQIIFYTSSYIVSETRRLAEACGVSIVIGKPIEPAEFLEYVRLALTTKQAIIIPPASDEFHLEHMRILTDTLVKKVDELEAEIVERKQAQSDLRNSEELFRTAFQYSPVGMCITTLEGRLQNVNQPLADMLGFTITELDGKHFNDITHPEDLEIGRGAIGRMLLGEIPSVSLEKRYLHKNGRAVCVYINSALLKDSSRKPLHFITHILDITERKQAEDALRESEQRFRSTLENMMEGCQIIGNDWRYLYINPSAEEQNRRPKTELLGNIFMDMWRGIESTALFTALQTCMTERTPQHLVTEFIFPDNSMGWFEVGVQRVPDGIFILSTNITERKQAEEALRESEQLFAKIFMDSPIAISMVGLPAGKNIQVNDAWCKLTGFSREEAIGSSTEELKIFDHKERNKLIKAFTEQGYSRLLESRLVRKSGEKREVLISSEVITNKGLQHILTSAIDITERKQAEEKIEYQANLLAHINDAIIAVDNQFRITAWNQAAEIMYGWDAEETLGSLSTDIIRSEMTEAERKEVLRQLQELGAYRIELIQYRKDGSQVHVDANTISLHDKDNQFTGLLSVNRDVTKRKKAEEKLQESEERLRQVWESTSDAMALSDVNGIMLSANPAALRLYGYTSEQIIGQSIAVTLPEEAREQVLEQYKAIFLSDFIPPTFENIVRRVDGAERIAESSITFLTNVTGQRTAMLSTVRDITDRKHAEDALRTSEQRYRGLFEDSPISIWEEDFSLVKQRLEALRGQGVSDFRSYFASHPEEMLDCASLVKITDVNKAGLQMYHAQNREDMLGSLREVITSNTLTSFHEELINITEGKTTFHWEGTDRTLIGEPIEVNLSWSVAPGHEHDYSRVIVSTIDITERKRAQEKTLRQLNYLTALQDIDRTIASAFDMQLSLNELISKAVSLLSVDAAAILLLNDTRKTLDFAAGDGFRTDKIKTASINLEKSYAGRAAVKQRIVKISNLQDEQNDLFISSFLDGDDFVSYYGVPLIVTGKTIGVMEVFQRSLIKRDQEWLDFLNALAGQAAIAISNAQLFDHLQQSHKELVRAYDSTIEGWSAALDLRDKETEGHSQRVTEMTVNLARNMGVGENELLQIRRGALLHDIGKLGIPDHILLKPGRLTDDEWVTMRKHPIYAYDMLSSVEYLKPALDIPYAHHEKWDGTGYPRKLKGEEIPFEARIFAIVDVWDALRSNRPYREGWPQEKVMDYLRAESGKHFDPQVVKAFLSLTIGIE